MTLIRAATPADRDAAVALWQSCDLTRPWNDPDADFDRALGHDAATILLADRFGMPVSTTHSLSSGVAGASVANGAGLQWRTIRNMALYVCVASVDGKEAASCEILCAESKA